MRVVVIASQKGGSGKTTTTGHLAVACEATGHGPAVLVDMDPQGSLAAWWNSRQDQTPAYAPTQLKELPSKLKALANAGYSYAFIDTPPAITEAIRAVVREADFVVVPVKPSPHDLRAVGDTVEIIQREGRPFVFVLSQPKGNALLTVQAMASLSEHGRVSPHIMHDRVDYASAMIDGRTVIETDPKGRSANEVQQLWDFVLERMHENTKTRKHVA